MPTFREMSILKLTTLFPRHTAAMKTELCQSKGHQRMRLASDQVQKTLLLLSSDQKLWRLLCPKRHGRAFDWGARVAWGPGLKSCVWQRTERPGESATATLWMVVWFQLGPVDLVWPYFSTGLKDSRKTYLVQVLWGTTVGV